MAQKAIREYDGKKMLSRLLPTYSKGTIKLEDRAVQITPETDFVNLEKENPWLKSEKLVAKPDQLIKRRGKNKLILLNATWDEVKKWISERMKKDISIDNITGQLNILIVEPFIPHSEEDEYYFAIRSVRTGDEILFYHQGGINVGDVDAKAERLTVGILDSVNSPDIENILLKNVPGEKNILTDSKIIELNTLSKRIPRKNALASFIRSMFELYKNNGFAYLEINPIVFHEGRVIPLDLAAKLDDTAEFECGDAWGDLKFPSPFGRELSEEEKYIRSLDEKTGASLKLTMPNPSGRIWTLVAGGGASVIYTDTIADLGFGKNLANYGEYSGNPNDEETYEYTKTVLDLMTREKDPEGKGKILLIGGGIANFTDVAKTFKGIIKALKEFKAKLKEVDARIYVRRGGPNYKVGLKNMRELGEGLGVPIEVYGPETHMTRIVKLALQ